MHCWRNVHPKPKGQVEMTIAVSGRLIGMATQGDQHRNTRQSVREFQVHWGGEDRIASEYHQQRNLSALEIMDQLAKRVQLGDWIRAHRDRVVDGGTNIS